MGKNIENRPETIRDIQERYNLSPLVRPKSDAAVVLISGDETGRDLKIIPVIQRESPPTEFALAKRISQPLISLEEETKAIEGVRNIVKQRGESQRNAIGSFFSALIGIVQNPPYERTVVDTTKYKGSLAGRARIGETIRETINKPVLPSAAGLTITQKPGIIEIAKEVILGRMDRTKYSDGTEITQIGPPLQQQRQGVFYESSTNGQKGTNEGAIVFTDSIYGSAGCVKETLTVDLGSEEIVISFRY